MKLHYQSVTKENILDFENLFGEKGACAGCWCMYWRLKRADYNAMKGLKNKAAMKKIIHNNTHSPGILVYDDKKPIAWCAISPRSEYPALERSRILKKVDDKKVWSITCLFIDKKYRKKGISVKAIQFACDHAKKEKAKWIEAYPVEAKKQTADVFIWTGIASAFLKAGFKEVTRRSESRPIMRKGVDTAIRL